MQYRWDFDATKVKTWGTWANGNPSVNSRKVAYGPCAGCVYEIPEGGGDKTFTVTLQLTDGTNTTSSSCDVQITVYDPAGPNGYKDNYYFSADSTWTGAPPADATHVRVATSSFDDAVATYLTQGRRLLFQSGQTFSGGSGNAVMRADGPTCIGKFGSGPSPLVNYTGTNPGLWMSSYKTPGIGDCRIMDISFNGDASSQSTAIRANGGINQVTCLRVNVTNIARGIVFLYTWLDGINAGGTPGHTMWDQWAVHDCSVTSMPTVGQSNYPIWPSGNNMSIQGNYIDMTGVPDMGGHALRCHYAYKAVFGHNTASSTTSQHCVKLHAPTRSGGVVTGVAAPNGGYTQYVVLSDNKWLPNGVFLVDFGAQNNYSDERVKDVIAERDWYAAVSSLSTNGLLQITCEDVTVRNNIFNLTNGTNSGRFAVGTQQDGVTGSTPPPNNIHIYNNTIYTGDVNTGHLDIAYWANAGTLAVTVKNNIFFTKTSGQMINDSSGGSAKITHDHNSDDVASIKTDPQFASATPLNPADFKIASGSYAVGAGTDVPVFLDYFGAAQLSPPDLGAIDH